MGYLDIANNHAQTARLTYGTDETTGYPNLSNQMAAIIADYWVNEASGRGYTPHAYSFGFPNLADLERLGGSPLVGDPGTSVDTLVALRAEARDGSPQAPFTRLADLWPAVNVLAGVLAYTNDANVKNSAAFDQLARDLGTGIVDWTKIILLAVGAVVVGVVYLEVK